MLKTHVSDREVFWPFSGFILSKTWELDRINFLPINKGISAKVHPIILSGLGTFDRIKNAAGLRNSYAELHVLFYRKSPAQIG